MFRSQQLLQSNIHIVSAAKPRSVLLTQHSAFYPDLRQMFSALHSTLSPVVRCEENAAF